jgi:hypothetical protein
MSLVIESLAGPAGCPIISIEPNHIAILIVRGGQLMVVGIILVVEVCCIYFCA